MNCNPNDPINPTFGPEGEQLTGGVTIRQLFAAMAMQGFLSPKSVGGDGVELVEWSVRIADALIDQLNKAQEKSYSA